jgi:fructose/tagatose bisphosphate aldolase
MARRTGASVEGEIGTMLAHGDRADEDLTRERLRQFFTMPIKTARIDHARLREIHQAVPTPLVFHGCTGLQDEEYRAAYTLGVKKFNIGTHLGEAFAQGLAVGVQGGKGALVCLEAGREAVYEAAKGRIAVLNSVGKA